MVAADGLNATIDYTAGASGGTDSLAYRICDTQRRCATAQVNISIGTAGCTIVGTSASEILIGTPGDDVICGLGGNDTLIRRPRQRSSS